jgi:hypothetical protein
VLGFVHHRPTNPKHGNTKIEIIVHRAGTNEHVAENMENLEKHFNRPEMGARAGLFIAGDQGLYYTMSQLLLATCPANRVHSQRVNLDHYITELLLNAPMKRNHV